MCFFGTYAAVTRRKLMTTHLLCLGNIGSSLTKNTTDGPFLYLM